jgi:hypothetical protein
MRVNLLSEAVGISVSRENVDQVASTRKGCLFTINRRESANFITRLEFNSINRISHQVFIAHVLEVACAQVALGLARRRLGMDRPHPDWPHDLHLFLQILLFSKEDDGEIFHEVVVELLFV